MTGWDKEYERYKHQYQELFDKCMRVVPVLVDMEISGYKLSTFEH